MGVLDKCCGNCAHSYAKDMDGYCACGVDDHFTSCDEVCDNHKLSINGWAELTPDDVEELYKSKRRVCIAFVCNGEVSYICGQFGMALSTMAKHGGYYYYVLPELKIE